MAEAIDNRDFAAFEQPRFTGWAVLEIMGHKVVAGYVEETTLAGAPMLKITIPPKAEGDDPKTQYYGGSSIYCMTPCSEEVARVVNGRTSTQPDWAWNLPKVQVPALQAPREPIEVDREPGAPEEPDPWDDGEIIYREPEYVEPEIHDYEDDY